MTAQPRSARDRLDRIFAILARTTRFWAAAAVVVLVGTLASIAYTFTRHRIYKSETLMLYREGIRSSDLGGPESGADPARKLGLKLKEMVFSRTRLQPIIEEFHLYPGLIEDRGIEDAVDELRTHISFRSGQGDTFGLSFEGEDPVRVQKVTARLAEALIVENSKHRAEQAEMTKDFLDAERKHAEDELRDKESALAKFLTKHPEFAREGQGSSAAALKSAQQKSGKPADPTLLALEREAARIQERLGMPVQKKKKDEPQADPKLVQAEKEAEADVHAAQRELADKLAQFTEQHPDVRAAKAKLKVAEAKLKRAQDALAGDVAAQQKSDDSGADEAVIDRATLESQLAKVNEEISAYKSKKRREESSTGDTHESVAAGIVALETEWSQLSRDVTEARTRTAQLQDKSFRASMVENATAQGQDAQITIVDAAFRPTHPIRPSRSLLLLAGLLISLAMAFGVALGLTLIDDRLYDRVDVERLEVAPLVGVVPRAERGLRG